jgi:gliding motility-associated-like protein
MVKTVRFVFYLLFVFPLYQLNAQVLVLSGNYTNAPNIEVQQDFLFAEFQLDSASAENIAFGFEPREYANQDYYFSFTMPQVDDAEIAFVFPDGLIAGMAAYSSENYNLLDYSYMHDSPCIMKLSHIETQNSDEILMRIWFSQSIETENVQIAIRSVAPLSFSRAINVSTSAYSPTELVEDVLVTGCLVAFNVDYTGDSDAIGYFSGNIGNSGFGEGVILSTGEAEEAEGPDVSSATGTSYYSDGDPDLQDLLPGFSISDASILEFDFIPATDTLRFEYIFGSEEFPEWANSSYNDVFGFFLSGPGINGPYSNNAINIALLPNGQPVTIDNLFNNSAYYVGSTWGSGGNGDAYDDDIEFDGASIPLVAEAEVIACETYHIKLAIGDAGDSSFDSGVFFKAGSFTSGAAFTALAFNPWYSTDVVYEGCDTYIEFTRVDASTINEVLEIPLSISGTADMGIDYATVVDTFFIQPGHMSDTLVIQTFEDTQIEGTESIVFTFPDGCPCENNTMEITIEINEGIDWVPELVNNGPICHGDMATLTVILPPDVDMDLVDWIWLETGSSEESIDVQPDITTTYTLEWLYPCQTLSYNTTVDVVYPPDVDLGVDFSIEGVETILDAGMSVGNTGYWEVIDGPGTAVFGDSSSANTTLIVDELGVYQIVWTEFSLPPNCFDSDTLSIEFYHIPTAEFEISPSLCFGDVLTVNFTGEVMDWATFTWDFGEAIVISGSGAGPYQIQYLQSGNYQISLTVDEFGYTTSETNSVYVPPLLEYSLNVFDDPCFNSCNGSAEIIVVGGTAPYHYSWGSGTSIIDNLCAGAYGITITDDNACTVGESFNVNQPLEITFDTAYQHVTCYGGNDGFVEINVEGGMEPYNYLWSNGGFGNSQNNLIAGQYSVTVRDANNCTVSTNFGLNQPANLQLALSSDVNICEGESVNLVASVSGGVLPTNIFWSFGNDGNFQIGSGVETVVPLENTEYAVFAEDAHGCVSEIQSMTVWVSPQMSMDLLVDDNSCYHSCDGRAEVTIVGGIAPFNYSWASNNRVLDNICADIYSLTVTDQYNCAIDTIFLVDEPSDIYFNTYITAATCYGVDDGMAWVDVVGGTLPYAFVWSTGDENDTITASGGNYSLTITDANNCRKTANININAPQPMDIIPDFIAPICIGGTANLSAEIMGGTYPYTFYWMGADSTIGLDHVFSVSPTEDADYYLTVTDANECEAYHQFHVPVNPPLQINSVSINQDTVCANSPVRLFVDAEGGNGGPYSIQLQDGQIIPSPFTIYPQQSQMWYITLFDECETPAVHDSIYITVWSIPEIFFVSDVVKGCPPLKVQFNELHENNDYEYVWEYGDGSVGFSQAPNYTYFESGLYDVSLSVTDVNACRNSLILPHMIEVFPKPNVDFYTEPEEASIMNPQIQFFSVSEDAEDWYWFFGDGDSSIWNVSNPIHFYDGFGEFEVILVGENSYQCQDTMIKTIRITDFPTFYAPTAFTPNGDGDNDCFRVCGNGIDPLEFYLVIYNRWGEIVYETDLFDSDANCDQCGEAAWDGSRGNRMEADDYLQPGIYQWYAKFMDSFGNWNEKQGLVRLAR